MPSNFDSVLEQDIIRLSNEVRKRVEVMPSQEISHREIVKSVIGSQIQASQQTQSAPQTQSEPSPMLPQYLQQESPEVRLKIEELVDLAFHKGIEASVSEAQKYGPFILDALHDTLSTKLYEELKSRKLLE